MVTEPERLRTTRRESLAQWGHAAFGALAGSWFLSPEDSCGAALDDAGGPSGGPTDVALPPVRTVRLKQRDGKEREVTGRVLVRAADDGLLLEDSAGRLWTVTPEQRVSEAEAASKYGRLEGDALAERLIEEAHEAGVKAEFTRVLTDHFVVVSTAGLPFAQWCATLLERLHRAFLTFWKGREFSLTDAEGPLPVLALTSREQFAQMAEFDETPGSAQGQGYFLATANRTVLFDLTSDAGTVSSGGRTPRQSAARAVAEVMARARKVPASVAAVIHEATHQLAFNSGLHRRYADNPLWLTEGLAMFFETPDLQSTSGWQTIGRVNRHRLSQFHELLKSGRPTNSLESLVRDNTRFAQAATALPAYAEAWALVTFLLRQRSRPCHEFLRQLAAKPPLEFATADQRLAEFQSHFGADMADLDREFLAFVRKL